MSNEHTIYYDLHDEIYDETFTVCIEKNGSGWQAIIPDVPDVVVKENSIEEITAKIPKILREALIAEYDTWVKKVGEDVQEGRLDAWLEKVEDNIKAGKGKTIEEYLANR